MYLPAITLGYAVPAGDFEASVHSVFDSALNLLLLDGDGLLTLVSASRPDLPQGIRLDTPKDFSFESFQVGEPAICRDGILRFESSSLVIQLSNARRWEFDLAKLEIDIGNPVVFATWNLVWEVLNQRQKRLKAEIIAEDLLHSDKTGGASFSSKAGRTVRDLVMATRQLDLTGASSLETLIGLGPGLTPSGDDILAGYMAGLWCTVRKHKDRAQFITELGKRVIDLSVRTNDISRTYLFLAARGQVSSQLTALAKAISSVEEPDHLLESAEQALQNGGTSGMDAVTGLLIGISAWNSEKTTEMYGNSAAKRNTKSPEI